MKFSLVKLVLCILTSLSYSAEKSANEIINHVIERFDGINCRFDLAIIKKQKSKPDKSKIYSISIFHPKNDTISRMIRLDTKKPVNLSEVSYWEHNYGIDKRRNRWLTLPITGKLKIIGSDEKIGDDPHIEDILFDLNKVLLNKNEIINNKIENNISISIIESIGSTKQHIWIDDINYRIVKVITYNKYGRVVKELLFSDFNNIDRFSMPNKVDIKDKKRKISYHAKINNFQLVKTFKRNFFQPKGK